MIGGFVPLLRPYKGDVRERQEVREIWRKYLIQSILCVIVKVLRERWPFEVERHPVNILRHNFRSDGWMEKELR
jgi:hypothetical protein